MTQTAFAKTETLVRLAAVCAALGIASSLTDYNDYGRWLAVAGVMLLIVSLHRFGRSGPDDAIVFEASPAPRKKKKKKKSEPPDAPASSTPDAPNDG